MNKTFLGKTELLVSKAGFGVLPLGPEQYALPLNEGAFLLRYAYDRGFNFYDTAQYYRTYPYLRRFFDDLKGENPDDWEKIRKDLVICSKSLEEGYGEMREAVYEALDDMGLEYIDIFLLHEVRAGQFKRRSGAWQALIDLKNEGLIKAIGVSTHHINTAVEMADEKECDVVFALINFSSMGIRLSVFDEKSDKNGGIASNDSAINRINAKYSIEKVKNINEIINKGEIEGLIDSEGENSLMSDAIRLLKDKGKGVFTMKALGGGNLTTDYQKALNYVFENNDIDSVMIGYGRTSDIDDILEYLEGEMPLEYNPDVSKKIMRVNQGDCIGCGSCIKACASGAISFSKDNGLAYIDNSKCLTCGYCAYACRTRAIIRF